MTRREAKAVEIIQRMQGFPIGQGNDIILSFFSTQLILEAMAWQAEECSDVVGSMDHTNVLNAGTEKA